MTTWRESIMVALLANLAAATGVTVASRRFTPFDEVANGDYPYLILMQGRETVDNTNREMGANVALHKMECQVLLYAQGDGTENSIPATALNNMVDAIESSLLPTFLGFQTLGLSFVRWVVINGPIEYDGSAYGNYGVAVVPLEVAYS